MTEPSFLKLHRSGQLGRRAQLATGMLAICELCHRVRDDPVLGRPPSVEEVEEARQMARSAGLTRLDDPASRPGSVSRRATR